MAGNITQGFSSLVIFNVTLNAIKGYLLHRLSVKKRTLTKIRRKGACFATFLIYEELKKLTLYKHQGAFMNKVTGLLYPNHLIQYRLSGKICRYYTPSCLFHYIYQQLKNKIL